MAMPNPPEDDKLVLLDGVDENKHLVLLKGIDKTSEVLRVTWDDDGRCTITYKAKPTHPYRFNADNVEVRENPETIDTAQIRIELHGAELTDVERILRFKACRPGDHTWWRLWRHDGSESHSDAEVRVWLR